MTQALPQQRWRTALAKEKPPLFWVATVGSADRHTVFYLSDEGTADSGIVGMSQLYIWTSCDGFLGFIPLP